MPPAGPRLLTLPCCRRAAWRAALAEAAGGGMGVGVRGVRGVLGAVLVPGVQPGVGVGRVAAWRAWRGGGAAAAAPARPAPRLPAPAVPPAAPAVYVWAARGAAPWEGWPGPGPLPLAYWPSPAGGLGPRVSGLGPPLPSSPGSSPGSKLKPQLCKGSGPKSKATSALGVTKPTFCDCLSFATKVPYHTEWQSLTNERSALG